MEKITKLSAVGGACIRHFRYSSFVVGGAFRYSRPLLKNMQNRMEACNDLVSSVDKNPSFLKCIVAGDYFEGILNMCEKTTVLLPLLKKWA